jgi:hypothetical protein
MENKWKNPPYKPRLYDDEDIAAISMWCRIHGYEAFVKLNGTIELNEKTDAERRR